MSKSSEKIFVNGPISPASIAETIANHQSETNIGAHSIFLGQVRADDINGEVVKCIDYTAYEDMVEKVMHDIWDEAFRKYKLSSAKIYHSLGKVNVGELCLFVFTSSRHRKDATESCRFLVENIKSKLPIFGKELFAEGHQWKTNTADG